MVLEKEHRTRALVGDDDTDVGVSYPLTFASPSFTFQAALDAGGVLSLVRLKVEEAKQQPEGHGAGAKEPWAGRLSRPRNRRERVST